MTPNMTFELLLHAAFVADEIWGFMREPPRMHDGVPQLKNYPVYEEGKSSERYVEWSSHMYWYHRKIRRERRVKSIHDMYLIRTWKCGSLSFIFTHPPED